MSDIQEYQHKKFQFKVEEYKHKKFGAHLKKRTFGIMEDKENQMTVENILKTAHQCSSQEPPAKRKPAKSLFRPWENKEEIKALQSTKEKAVPSPVLSEIPSNVLNYNPNMVRQYAVKPRSEKEQLRRNRNTLACLINRRNQQAEQQMLQQQYLTYQQQHAAMMEQSVRAALYLRHLQELALQRQQQLFVFGQQRH
uniref:Uncharacterized protein n=1 Tax=Stomoxys calcitrans TaxID=35570 RepID=A0A1I8PBA0_STOCA